MAPFITSEEVGRDVSESPSPLSINKGTTSISRGTIFHCPVKSTVEHLISMVPTPQIQQHPITPVTVTIRSSPVHFQTLHRETASVSIENHSPLLPFFYTCASTT